MGRRKEIIEKRMEIIEALKKLDENVDIIIVEGKRDKYALRKLGCKANIITLGEAHKPLLTLIEDLNIKYTGLKIVILMDFDEEGEKLNKKIERMLEGSSLRIERTLKDRLKKAMLEENRRRIEELIGLLKEEI
ncbi:MAG: toprim domain-containing protein [archaeon YNP-LCB-024-027]|jgi:5S rRNA maturation endonuclease (ribonuclease M5)|nr:toprim domain-containing protein [Candidatus Culexarchaeum yellowstonense]